MKHKRRLPERSTDEPNTVQLYAQTQDGENFPAKRRSDRWESFSDVPKTFRNLFPFPEESDATAFRLCEQNICRTYA